MYFYGMLAAQLLLLMLLLWLPLLFLVLLTGHLFKYFNVFYYRILVLYLSNFTILRRK